jgi:hypothetical protein
MRGSDRCDEIVRLIDESLGSAPATKPEATSPGRPATHHGLLPRYLPGQEHAQGSAERQQLLAAVGDFLACTLADVA